MHFRPPEEQNDHKVTCGIHSSVEQLVTDHIHAALGAANVQANVILSGQGDWRFLDIVSRKAGKLEALQYVQNSLGFDHHQTIACGDSGNDRLMLDGECLACVVGNS